MNITNQTTTWQIAELMGEAADERDGRIMLSILGRECETDTDAISADQWDKYLQEAASTRREVDAEK